MTRTGLLLPLFTLFTLFAAAGCAGLTPLEALRSATLAPARYLGRGDSHG